MKIARLVSSLTLGATLLAGCGDDGGPDMNQQELVDRGDYIVNNIAQCAFCHTPRRQDGSPDFTQAFSGVDCFEDLDPGDDQVGCLPTRNLTDHPTGLANATDAEVKAAIFEGVGIDGRDLTPVMPYWLFDNMTDEDKDAVVAYLRTIPGIEREAPPVQPPWTMIPPKDTIPLADLPDPRPNFDGDMEAAVRGKYLTAVSLCVDCHTPEMTPGMLDFDLSLAMAGNREFPAAQLGLPVPPYDEVIYTSNLTPHATGLEGYTREDITEVLRDGINPDNEGVCAPTHVGQASPYAGLTDEDVADVVEYLVSLEPVDNAVTADCVGPLPN